MKTANLFIRIVFLFGTLYIFSSCNVLYKGMTSSDYYHYLREDTVICELSTYTVAPSLEFVLNTSINYWSDCLICKEDPHPFIFELEEVLHGDTLTYTIITNSSTKIAHHNYVGAFVYEGYIFAITEKSEDKSMLIYDKKNEPTTIFFCDRIHSSKCGLTIKCQCVDESCKVTSIVCQEEEIIKIK